MTGIASGEARVVTVGWAESSEAQRVCSSVLGFVPQPNLPANIHVYQLAAVFYKNVLSNPANVDWIDHDIMTR